MKTISVKTAKVKTIVLFVYIILGLLVLISTNSQGQCRIVYRPQPYVVVEHHNHYSHTSRPIKEKLGYAHVTYS